MKDAKITITKVDESTTNIVIEPLPKKELTGFEIAEKVRNAILDFRRDNYGDMPDFALVHVDYRNRLFDYIMQEQLCYGNDMHGMRISGVLISIVLYMKDPTQIIAVSTKGGNKARFFGREGAESIVEVKR